MMQLFDDCIMFRALKASLFGTYAFKLQMSVSERAVAVCHGCHTALKFGTKAKNQYKVPMLYRLPKLHQKL